MTDKESKDSVHVKRQLRYVVVAFLLIAMIGFVVVFATNGVFSKWFAADSLSNVSSRQLWTCGMHPQVIQDHPGECPICHMELTPLKSTVSTTNSGERKVKYWWDPMLGPSSISDKPGKSAMGMDLVPVYDDDVAVEAGVVIDPVIVQNMGVRTATVIQGPLRRMIRAVGVLKEVEPNRHDVSLRVSGWIEKLFANTEGIHVRKGDPLFELYSPQLQVAAEELISARRAVESAPKDDQFPSRTVQTFYEAARQKLLNLGVDEQQADRISRLDSAPKTITFTSPITGHITEQMIVEGSAVNAGERIFRIVDHSTLWLDAQIPESLIPFIQLQQNASASIDAMPGQVFEGKVTFIHPHVDPETRTAMIRLAIPNPSMTLKPAMYATVLITSELAADALLVPREAIIDTGTRQIAFLSLGKGHFEPRQVRMGSMGEDDRVQILDGLAPGDTVVTSGQFLLDAESRLKEAIQKHLNGDRAARH